MTALQLNAELANKYKNINPMVFHITQIHVHRSTDSHIEIKTYCWMSSKGGRKPSTEWLFSKADAGNDALGGTQLV